MTSNNSQGQPPFEFKPFYSGLLDFWDGYHSGMNQFSDSKDSATNATQSDDSLQIRKNMLKLYIYTSIFYFILLSIMSTQFEIKRVILYLSLSILQLVLYKYGSYNLTTTVCMILPVINIYMSSKNETHSLRMYGFALLQHNQIFLMSPNTYLRMGLFGAYIALIFFAKCSISSFIPLSDIPNMELNIQNFLDAAPIMFMVNHIFAVFIVKQYMTVLSHNREIQNKLEKANKELSLTNKKLNEALSKLEKTNKELSEVVKTKELFVASVTHELRNPLNAMLGNIELIEKVTTDTEALKMIDSCKVCGELALSLINNVLDVAKIHADKFELNCKQADFYAVLEKVWNVSTVKIRQNGLKGLFYISPTCPRYLCLDSHRISQILLNLLGNATKFTRRGFIKIVISWHTNTAIEQVEMPNINYLRRRSRDPIKKSYTELQKPTSELLDLNTEEADTNSDSEESEVESAFEDNKYKQVLTTYRKTLQRSIGPRALSDIKLSNFIHMDENDSKIEVPENRSPLLRSSTTTRNGILKFEIIDSGTGISQDALEHLFQPFTQADASIASKFGGTGLGLYITKQLITKMNGKINAYSQEGVGSIFSIALPVNVTNCVVLLQGENSQRKISPMKHY